MKIFSDLLYDIASHHMKLKTITSTKKYKLTQHFIDLFRNTNIDTQLI